MDFLFWGEEFGGVLPWTTSINVEFEFAQQRSIFANSTYRNDNVVKLNVKRGCIEFNVKEKMIEKWKTENDAVVSDRDAQTMVIFNGIEGVYTRVNTKTNKKSRNANPISCWVC